jgi:nicotinamidase-related amidase
VSIFADRTEPALLVIDVQADVMVSAWHRDQVIANIKALIATARASNVPIIWIQHSDPYMEIGTDAWQIVKELQPLPGEPNIRKEYRSSFEETELEKTLAQLCVGHLYICGAETNNCVRHTSHAALERGYDVTLVEDAHTTSDGQWGSVTLLASAIIEEQNCSFSNYTLPGRSASIVKTEKISF